MMDARAGGVGGARLREEVYAHGRRLGLVPRSYRDDKVKMKDSAENNWMVGRVQSPLLAIALTFSAAACNNLYVMRDG